MADATSILDDAYPQGSPSTADILARIPQPSWHDQYVKPWGSVALAQQEPNWFGRNVLEPASRVPGLMEIAAFIGPKGAGNLARAGIRHGDEWGGINRLAAAREQPGWMRPGSPEHAEIWKNYGWTPEHTWGKPSEISQPATAVATPKFSIDEGAFQPMRSGDYTIQRAEGKLPDVTHGLDELLVAEPSLADVFTMMRLDPRASYGGVTNFEPYWRQHQTGISVGKPPRGMRGLTPTGYMPRSISVTGQSMQDLHDLMLHEALGHGSAIPQGVAPGSLVSDVSQHMQPIKGTAAEAALKQKTLAAKLAYDRSMEHALRQSTDAEPVLALMNRWHELRGAQQKAPSRAGYLHGEEERVARETFLRGLAPLEQHKPVAPGAVDTYQPGAFGKSLERELEVPLKLYDPNYQP